MGLLLSLRPMWPHTSSAPNKVMESIGEIEAAMAKVSGHACRLIENHLEVKTRKGELALPPLLEAKVGNWFSLPGDDFPQKAAVERACKQRVLCLRNKWTLETTHFNPLRALRPSGASGAGLAEEDALIDAMVGANDSPDKCDFCAAVERCAVDTWGRVEGSHWISGANVAKFEGSHGVLLLKQHHPLRWGGEGVSDLLSTFHRWAEKTHEVHPAESFPSLLWNCLPRAGSSQLHGHAQCILSPGGYIGAIRTMAESAGRYLHEGPPERGSDYVGDLVSAHAALGLVRGVGGGVSVMAYLCPRKEKELWVVGAPGAPVTDPAFARGLWVALQALRDEMGVRCFNACVVAQPVGGKSEPPPGFPRCVARVIDRGSAKGNVSDMAAAEVFAVTVVAADPCHVVAAVDRVCQKMGISGSGGDAPAPSPAPPQHGPGAPSQWVERHIGLASGTGAVDAFVGRPAIPPEAAGRCLDVACGGGRHLRLALSKGLGAVGVDRDTAAAAKLLGSSEFPGCSLELVEADLEVGGGGSWPRELAGRRFAAVVVTNYLHRPLEGPLLEAVAPGGVVIYETFAVGNEAYGRPRSPEFLLKPGELLEWVGRGGGGGGKFQVVAYEHAKVAGPNGPAVVQRVCAVRTA